MRFLLVLLFIFFNLSDRIALAQDAEEEPFQLSESGSDYLKAVRFKGIDTDVVFFNPAGPPPDLETEKAPEPQANRLDNGFDFSFGDEWRGLIILALVAFVAVLLIMLVRSGASVSLGSEAVNAKRKTRDGAAIEDSPSVGSTDLDTILRQTDRQQALVRLSQFVLAQCLNANGVLFQRSWTQREALHKLPSTLPGLDSLRALVIDSERVSFGGRKISDGEFRAHLSRVRPLLQAMAQ